MMKNKQTLISAAIVLACGTHSQLSNAVLPSLSQLNITAGNVVCNAGVGTPPDNCAYGTNVPTGSFFSMDTSGNGTVQNGEKVAVANNNGIILGSIQPASGSHTGGINGAESPGIDAAWEFFGNTGMHQTTTAITILSDDGSGNVTLDFQGWDVTWNGIPSIPMGGCQFGNTANNGGFSACDSDQDGTDDFVDSPIATMTCGSDCSDGDTFTIIHSAHVPVGDPSNFGGVLYGLNLVGTITDTNTAPVCPDLPSLVGDTSQPTDIDIATNITDAQSNYVASSTITISNSTACASITDDGDGTLTFPICTAGIYTFDYSVSDSAIPAQSCTGMATVTLSANPPPTVVNDTATAEGVTPVVINVLSNDSDPGGSIDATSVAIASTPSNGSVGTPNPTTGAITYTANANFSGVDTFTYTVDDNTAQTSSAATVTVTVNAMNAPAAGTGTFVPASGNGIVTASEIGITDSGSSAEQGIAQACVGGCFDFSVTGLTPGSDAQVVLPLSTPIITPAFLHQNIYRKLNASNIWQDFDASGSNAVDSATGTVSGSDVSCPPASDSSYTPGITPGDNCLRLTITDGGPNDRDGTADGTVVDPGGLADTFAIDTRVSFTDGCNMSGKAVASSERADWWIIAGFLALMAMFRFKRKKI